MSRKTWNRTTVRHHRPLPHGTYPGYPAVASQSAKDLWDRLVRDGTARHPTPLSWLLAAVDRIAHIKRTTTEVVFRELDEAVPGGLPRQPGRL